ncbi:MAG TPA: BTAD domain-containing putative transcriptional regulator, partial [Actinospica sp.]|nr:BTAD domain-containing putative transcriptional regulator [Actinospica sp.]
ERQAEALEVYRRLRRTLVDELSLEPCAALRLLHQRILARDSALTAPAPAPAPGDRPWAGGHGARFNLPPDTSAFTGRERELAELYEFEDAARRLGSGAAAVVAIDGMAGIGKTALALHAAHRMAERFPDGRMFLDLRGHSPGLTPLDPAEALDYFLRCLGVPPQLIPPDPQARSAFYREGMMKGTSPSIAALAGGGYELAFQANTGSLIVFGSGGNTNTGQGMLAGTSPAIA